MSVLIACILLAVLVIYSITVPLLSSVDDHITDFSIARQPPSAAHFFGTDSAGHDVFYQVARGMQVSLLIAVCTAVVSAVVGVLVGVSSGSIGGWYDRIVMRLVDGVNALPSLLLGLLIVAMFRGSVVAIIISLVITHWTSTARIVRSQVMSLRHADFVMAAQLGGKSSWSIMLRHFVPATAGQALLAVVLLIPHTIWHESTLSFLGVGLPPDKPSLGTLLSDAEASLLLGNWWTLAFPGLLLIIVTLCVSVIGNHASRRWSDVRSGGIQ